MSFVVVYLIFSALLIVASILPYVSNQYWVFRVCEFARIQILILQIALLLVGFLLPNYLTNYIFIVQAILFVFVVFHVVVLAPYIPLKRISTNSSEKKNCISILSINVYQPNNLYDQLIQLIKRVNPDMFLTMESNTSWEKAISVLDEDYPYHKKIALENTYGMHFYSKIEIDKMTVNYFMADDIPSIEALLTTSDNQKFKFYGIHPPPPSPTEEDTSKERDGELLMIGKQVKKSKHPVVVVGDFNNVAWSKSTILFRKMSGLKDPRIGRGFYSTYHAKYRFLRFPIDLFFHSNDIVIEEFKTLEGVGSDHLPLYCRFFIDPKKNTQQEGAENLDKDELNEVEEMIEQGKEEEGDRPSVLNS